MDIWAWVTDKYFELKDNDQDRLADIMVDISSAVVNDEHDKVKSLYHEGLAIAQEIDDHWVQVFLGHWYLQSNVFNLYNAREILPKAVDLLDLAHTDDAKGCPQRICVVQDLAGCYGIKDGPAYFEERKAVALETLAEIDGRWPCYECIAAELIDAYMDKGDYETALLEINKHSLEIKKHQKEAKDIMSLTRTAALLGLDRYDEAWDLISTAENEGGGDGFVKHKHLTMAYILCKRGDYQKAMDLCPDVNEATYYQDWVDVKVELAKAGQISIDQTLLSRIQEMADDLRHKEASRSAIELYELLFELSLLGRWPSRAQMALTAIESIIPELYKDMGASENYEKLSDQFKASGLIDVQLPTFETIEAALAFEFENDDIKFMTLKKLFRQYPDHIYLIITLGCMHADYGDRSQGLKLLKSAYLIDPNYQDLEDIYGKMFIQENGFDAYQAAFTMDRLDGLDKHAIKARGELHLASLHVSQPVQAIECLLTLLQHFDADPDLLQRIVDLALAEKDYELAHRNLQALVDISPENISPKLQMLVTADLLNDQAAYKKMCDATHQSETALKGKMLLIHTLDQDGDDCHFKAICLSPTRARIDDIYCYSDDHGFGDEIMFNPIIQNAKELIEDDDALPIYKHVKTVSRAHYTDYMIEGFHPGDDFIEQMFKGLNAVDVQIPRSDYMDYELEWKEIDREINKIKKCSAKGFCITVMIKEETDLMTVHQALTDMTKNLGRPLVWPDILEKLDLPDELKEHKRLQNRYDF